MSQSLLPRCHHVLEQIRMNHGCSNPGDPDWRLTKVIHELFAILNGWPIADIEALGMKFSKEQLDLFVQYMVMAPDSRVSARLAVLFYYYRKNDYEKAVQVLCYSDQEGEGFSEFHTWFKSQNNAHVTTHGWVYEFFSGSNEMRREEFLFDGFKSGAIQWKDFQSQAPDLGSPFVLQVLDGLFEKGIEKAIPSIGGEIANKCAKGFLAKGENLKLSHFLKFFPTEKWQPEVIDAVYKQWGPPDPEGQKWYSRLERGVLWSFRKRLFVQKLPLLYIQEMRVKFWRNWIHHCTDIRIQGTAMCFSFGRLNVFEEPDYSRIHYVAEGTDQIQIQFGPEWETRMNQILNEYLY